MELHALGKTLIVLGIGFVVIGIFVLAVHTILHIGTVPGDIVIKKDSVTFYFPLGTCLVASAIISLIIWLFSRR
ncbi:MAG TPA: DUF2905 domain-containing protein [Candidatus Omnitrophota bacterium]|nr:DUF2905 domain-containing protein [Candidatus Omnitrophota bacterium]HPT06761.1 DUF2905 domain-containing protein [Candidatus Omnitrophota bacterium]